MQGRRNSIANALELRLSCSNPSICGFDRIHVYLAVRVLPVPSIEWVFLDSKCVKVYYCSLSLRVGCLLLRSFMFRVSF